MKEQVDPAEAMAVRVKKAYKDGRDPARWDAQLLSELTVWFADRPADFGALVLKLGAAANCLPLLLVSLTTSATARRAARRGDQPPPDRRYTADDVATIDDLERAGVEIRWLWRQWIVRSAINIVAAEGGVGKTRFAADLLRRVRFGLPWPDGSEMTLPRDAVSLWVVSDNHHGELRQIARNFDIKPVMRLNAHPKAPFDGVTLDNADDLADMEARAKAVGAALVIIDTTGNSTAKKLHTQEEAMAYFQPLQIIARRLDAAVLALTHLNAEGRVLGIRSREKARVVIQMTHPDPDGQPNRRRLWVEKSFDEKPRPLGVTMSSGGNDYDFTPPVTPEFPQGPTRTDACEHWLRDFLKEFAYPDSEILAAAEAKGFKEFHVKAAKQRLRGTADDGIPDEAKLHSKPVEKGGVWWNGFGKPDQWKRRPEPETTYDEGDDPKLWGG